MVSFVVFFSSVLWVPAPWSHPTTLPATHLLSMNPVNIITEFASGGDLQTRMYARQMIGLMTFSEEELAPIIRIVCDTLNVVHGAGWAHRGLTLFVFMVEELAQRPSLF